MTTHVSLYRKLLQLLQQEALLFGAARDNEREKNRAIVSANGKDLYLLTRKSEELLTQAEVLQRRRFELLREIARHGSGDAVALREDEAAGLSLSAIESRFVAAAPELAESAAKVVADYRSALSELATRNEENGRLLRETGASVNRLLGDLEKVWVDHDATYSGVSGSGQRPKPREPRALLINANA